ncbi:protein translocase subunit SecF [Nocardioides agariphilus]|uniref:Protein-export membrane protein SecF n=1 Tax=Nocardioides agariphilus TaxID=433664 RepID=A0A930VR31_9ACTN|nr:protein translocase subunit SecF [Nocardioides agariphilus]MBF4770266.1 protein translocase subunit SecF [Nocardioides agariphilus]
MGKFSRLGNELYSGKRSVNFVGRKWLWYAMSGVIVLLAVGGLYFKGLDMGIEFVGGAQYKVTVADSAPKVNQTDADKIREAVAASGIAGTESPVVNTAGERSIIVQVQTLTTAQSEDIRNVLAQTMDVDPTNGVSEEQIGASWGKDVAKRSATGLVVFLVLVVLFIWAYFREWKMSVAAIVALAHDVIITIGVYALSGFEVTPATVTGLLTILGFSLYDTVVVFDKVRENTKNLRAVRMTYPEAANLAVNQTLVRSINTSIVALIPVGAILYVGAVQLGAGSLKDLALALFVGMAAGTYSSIFIATPLLAHMKQGETANKQLEKRLAAKRRHQADDRYANVPVFADDLPVRDESDDLEDDDELAEDVVPPATTTPAKPVPTGRGRVVPQASRPVTPSTAAGRAQPTRQSRSKRGKK